MANQVWYVDGRTMRTKSELKGRTANPFLNNADLKNLNDIIYQVVYDIIPGTPTGALNVYNGLTSTVTPTSYDIVLGGNITSNTTLDGSGIENFTISGINNLVLDAAQLQIQGPTLAGASNGDVWTLLNSGTGEGGWAPDSSVVLTAGNGINIDGTEIQLGGLLTEDTTIDGDANNFDVVFTDLDTFYISNTSILDITTQSIFIDIPSTASTQVGYILAETVAGGGQVEWKPNNIRPIFNTLTDIILDDTYYTVTADALANGGNITVALPDPALNVGQMYKIKLVTAGTLSVECAVITGEFYTSTNVPSLSTAVVGTTYTVQSDGLYWQVL